MTSTSAPVGLGDDHYQLGVCIANRPPFMGLAELANCRTLVSGEIKAIGDACGNGWRKVFNVYAKLMWAMAADELIKKALPAVATVSQFDSWQAYRDAMLLQPNCGTALLFSSPLEARPGPLYLVMGKGYGTAFSDRENGGLQLEWLSERFAIDRHRRLIVCPYFDYRQLSNQRIDELVVLIRRFCQ
ncbi:DUF6942 family protein [Shewanella sp. FJAT-52076]|uniref:DUF6942 family protein n=1 Tax=Shewanella sp. FJAT-52076 TaxID=2864202 RepID=UPI001C657346|nr:hypothetical protein [Shewanella sp. FJAT-52076]QYJ74449.1 hypothetical protein K0H79_13935 [Shewanella sp. FJAT-52076]